MRSQAVVTSGYTMFKSRDIHETQQALLPHEAVTYFVPHTGGQTSLGSFAHTEHDVRLASMTSVLLCNVDKLRPVVLCPLSTHGNIVIQQTTTEVKTERKAGVKELPCRGWPWRGWRPQSA